jgi:hypothetical protein
MKKKINFLMMSGAALCLALGVSGTSGATQINNTNLSVPFVTGSGNTNQHFAVDNENGVEVGLKAKLRFQSDVTPTGNIYNVPTGYQTSPTTYANWNFDFSVLFLNAGSYYIDLAYDIDPSAAQIYKHITSPIGANFQDSWNYGMGFLGTGFNANLDGTYDIDLSVYNLPGNLLADSHIQVVVGDGAAPVPEPGTMMLLGLGMAGLAVFGKRRMNRKA